MQLTIAQQHRSLAPATMRRRARLCMRRFQPEQTAQDGSSGRNPVFQLDGYKVDLDLDDVRDAVEVCSYVRNPGEKAQCYAVFGLDADKVERYYEPVQKWEEAIDQGDTTGKRLAAFGMTGLAIVLGTKLRHMFF